MVILALAILLAVLAWFGIRRMQDADPRMLRSLVRWLVAGFATVLALRVAFAAPLPLRVALIVLALGGLLIWLRGRGRGGGWGDGGDDPPTDPGPGPRPDHYVVPGDGPLDQEEFDRARAEWEDALKRHAAD